MTRTPAKPNVYRKTVRRKLANGKVNVHTFYYYRKIVDGKEHLVRLPDDPDSPEFDREYWAIRSGTKPAREIKTTLNALLSSYQRSARYRRLKVASQDKYDRHAKIICDENGTKDARKLRRRDVIAMRDAYADTPRKANYMVRTMSVMMRHAVDLEWVERNPCDGVEMLPTEGEYTPWTEGDQRAYLKFAEGTALTAFMLGTGTGQRPGDLCKMKWSDFDGEYMLVEQQKTGEQIAIFCPPKLREYLRTLPRQGEYILAKGLRDHIVYNTVQKAVARTCKAAGLTGRTMHGWRYTAAVELAEAGCSDAEIAAVTGHKTLAMVQKYRAKASQKRMSKSAQERRK